MADPDDGVVLRAALTLAIIDLDGAETCTLLARASATLIDDSILLLSLGCKEESGWEMSVVLPLMVALCSIPAQRLALASRAPLLSVLTETLRCAVANDGAADARLVVLAVRALANVVLDDVALSNMMAAMAVDDKSKLLGDVVAQVERAGALALEWGRGTEAQLSRIRMSA